MGESPTTGVGVMAEAEALVWLQWLSIDDDDSKGCPFFVVVSGGGGSSASIGVIFIPGLLM